MLSGFLLVVLGQKVAAHSQTDSSGDCEQLLAAQGMYADGFLSDLPPDLRNVINGITKSWQEMNEDFGKRDNLKAAPAQAKFALSSLADEIRRVESAQSSLAERLQTTSDGLRQRQLKWVLALLESYHQNLSHLRQNFYAINQNLPRVLH